MKLSNIAKACKSLIYCMAVKSFKCRDFRFTHRNLLADHVHFDFEKKAKISLGQKFSCRRNVQISCCNDAMLEIGDNVFFNTNSVIACHKHITIGNNVKFGPGIYMYDHDHTYVDGKITQEYAVSDIIIEDDAWIGANCVILKGTHIGKGCIFGAGCIIKGKYDDNSVVVQKRVSTLRRHT